jgi:di/tricarboxylate transporter
LVLREGDVLLLPGSRDAIRGLQADNDLLVLEQLEKDLPTVSRKGMAIAISVLVVLLAALEWLPLVAAVLLGTVAMMASGCLRLGELQRAIRPDVILLLGSVACFSVALEKTGLGQPPQPCVYAVLFGANPSLLSPVGYQTNRMVFVPDRYRFLDITLYCLPLTLTMKVVVPLLICRHFNR